MVNKWTIGILILLLFALVPGFMIGFLHLIILGIQNMFHALQNQVH